MPATRVIVPGTNQNVGAIDGSGTTQINAGSDLTANHVIQSALIIGGSPGSPALMTISPSDAAGNALAGPLSAANTSLTSDRVELPASMTDWPLPADSAGTFASQSFGDSTRDLDSKSVAASATVPEPATWIMIAQFIVGFIGLLIARRMPRTTRQSAMN